MLHREVSTLSDRHPHTPTPTHTQCELESGLPDVWKEELVGEGVVLKVFHLTGKKFAVVGGCRVKQGKFVRSATFRLLREGEVC